MRVLQLIDSLDAGGAERMAVNYANLLSDQIECSYLCTTRKEGLLLENVKPQVSYFFLKKKKRIDIKAIRMLSRFIKREKIEIVHAHATSFFLATQLKILNRSIKLIWHDHYGNSEYLCERPKTALRYCSNYFDLVISVNLKLKEWAVDHLNCNNVLFFKNFYLKDSFNDKYHFELKGVSGKRVVCLANLRPQKNHLLLLSAFKDIIKEYPEWTLHFIGNNHNDAYYRKILKFIKTNSLEGHVFFTGPLVNVQPVLKQADIGVLSSISEGLPLALIEYGFASLPVIVTNVGQCSDVVSGFGKVVPPSDKSKFVSALEYYISNPKIRKDEGKHYSKYIEKNYSAEFFIDEILSIYKNIGL